MDNETFRHFERPTTSKPEFQSAKKAWNLVLVAIIGLLTGMVGYSIAQRLYPPVEPYDATRNLISSGLIESLKLDTEDLRLEVQEARSYDVAIYVDSAIDAQVRNELPVPSAYIAPGIALTSDGWILTSAELKNGLHYAVIINDTLYPIIHTKKDDFTGLTFAKVEVQLTLPVTFADDLQRGQLVYYHQNIGQAGYQFGIAYIANDTFFPFRTSDGLSKSSAEVGNYIQLQEITPMPAGTAYYNRNGEFVGMVVGTIYGVQNLLVSSSYIKLAFEDMVLDREYTDLGIWYSDLHYKTAEELRGIVLTHPFRIATFPNSIATTLGLEDGDRIIALNNELLRHPEDFDVFWRKNLPTAAITLTVIRHGEELHFRYNPTDQ